MVSINNIYVLLNKSPDKIQNTRICSCRSECDRLPSVATCNFSKIYLLHVCIVHIYTVYFFCIWIIGFSFIRCRLLVFPEVHTILYVFGPLFLPQSCKRPSSLLSKKGDLQNIDNWDQSHFCVQTIRLCDICLD